MGRWGLRINENVTTIGELRKELSLPSVGKETGFVFYQWLLIVIQVDDHHPGPLTTFLSAFWGS